MVIVTKPAVGRGAWPQSGTGGTLDLAGRLPGAYYRAPAGTARMPGLNGAEAVQRSISISLNDYAVYMAVRSFQGIVAATVDGIFGPNTGKAVAVYQHNRGLTPDGIIGPATAKAMYAPMVTHAAGSAEVGQLSRGHIAVESSWDPGAVGVNTPDDAGLGQINGPSHPTLTLEDVLTPMTSIKYVVKFVTSNLDNMGNLRDAAAAYNLGVGGARDWIKDGRPDVWTVTYYGKTSVIAVKAYIDKVLAAGMA